MDQTNRANQVQISKAKLHIRLLGDFRLVYTDMLINEISSPRLRALLAYLVLHRQAPQPRQYLAFQIWPDSNEAQARTNLRQLVHSMKQKLPEADQFLQTDAQTLQWQPVSRRVPSPCRRQASATSPS